MTTDPRPDLRAQIEALDSFPGWSMRPPNARRWGDRDDILALIPEGSVLVTPQLADNSVCVCGLAKSYHDGRLRSPEEYRPRYAASFPEPTDD
jgi:hypothetical protein